ncbi:fluoride efflux transporter CrcB [Alkalimarinus sediminis]|uniref:Fluoride-specific ion channel FluC n=1 Tax=Alkalimarinus sediminis TaxID=1632866 RepID=A0A9E8HN97_9ALTE|nr:fluoride efflux transporter CrcB [Alkalimarinus sediminis]UZW76066.1 fluoride efflux transporter CrcB [Alkalimarinus sediminis]
MLQVIAIALGGAFGALSRYFLIGLVTDWLGRGFPFGTLLVNVLGSFLIGILYVLIVLKMHVSPELKSILVVGFLGAFTTFSTFSLEAFIMISQGLLLSAVTYILSSVILCILAVWAGISLAKII